MPALFSLGQRAALGEVQARLAPSELLLCAVKRWAKSRLSPMACRLLAAPRSPRGSRCRPCSMQKREIWTPDTPRRPAQGNQDPGRVQGQHGPGAEPLGAGFIVENKPGGFRCESGPAAAPFLALRRCAKKAQENPPTQRSRLSWLERVVRRERSRSSAKVSSFPGAKGATARACQARPKPTRNHTRQVRLSATADRARRLVHLGELSLAQEAGSDAHPGAIGSSVPLGTRRGGPPLRFGKPGFARFPVKQHPGRALPCLIGLPSPTELGSEPGVALPEPALVVADSRVRVGLASLDPVNVHALLRFKVRTFQDPVVQPLAAERASKLWLLLPRMRDGAPAAQTQQREQHGRAKAA